MDPDGKFVYVSPSYGDRLGFTPDELIDTSFFELIHPEDRDNVIQSFHDTRRSESGQAQEFRCANKEGDWRTLQSIGNWIFGSSGKPQCEIVVSRDITERKQIEQTRIQLEEQLRHSQKMEAIGQLPEASRMILTTP